MGLFALIINICIINIVFLCFDNFSVLAKTTDKHFFEDKTTSGKKSRLEYETNLYEFLNSNVGKIFLKNLKHYSEEINNAGISTAEIKDVTEDNKTLHKRVIYHSKKFKVKYPRIEDFVSQIRHAVKKVFSSVMHTVEEEEKEELRKKRKKGEEEEESKIYNEEVKNAITLNNTLNILSILKKSLTTNEYKKLLNNEKLLATKIIRPDISMNIHEFIKRYTGEQMQDNAEKLLNKCINSFNAPDKNIDSLPRVSFFHTEKATHNINKCKPSDNVCDRRQYSKSCESRIEVEDQKACGVCWIFSSLAHLEILHCMESGKDIIYSKQEILDCDLKDCSAKGSYLVVLNYLTDMGHLSNDEQYPYEAHKFVCRNVNKRNVWTGYFPSKFDCTTYFKANFTENRWIPLLKQIAAYKGSFIGLVDASPLRFPPDKAVYLCSDPDELNHAILVTGWTILDGVPVWVVRNSWGYWWGDKGYAYIAMTNEYCEKASDPIPSIYAASTIKWLDSKKMYKVIKTRTKKESDKKLMWETAQIESNVTLQCYNSTIIHIDKVFVRRYENGIPDEKACNNLEIEKICNNQSSCFVDFPRNICPHDYNFLYVFYQCIPSTKYNCSLAISNNPNFNDDECFTFCNEAVNNCVPVTKECLYEYVDSQNCNLDNVFERIFETKQYFDCSQAKAKSFLISNKQCQKKCNFYKKKCDEISTECLYSYVPAYLCNFDSTVK